MFVQFIYAVKKLDWKAKILLLNTIKDFCLDFEESQTLSYGTGFVLDMALINVPNTNGKILFELRC